MNLPDITWMTPYYHVLLDRIPLSARTFLDVGAGYGIFGYIIKKSRNPIRLDAIEPFYDDLPFYDNVQKCEWKDAKKDFKYDVIICTEVIEHMTKEDAIAFLKEAREHARLVIIGTPTQFRQQPTLDNNPLQSHKCVLLYEDFIKSGYTVEFFNQVSFLAYSNAGF